MLTIEQLKKEFINQGHTAQSAQIHAECKYKANIHFDVNIKNKRRFISPALHNVRPEILKPVKKFFKNKGITYLRDKFTRKTTSKVAIPSPQYRHLSQHKLSPEDLTLQHALKHGVTGFNDKSYMI